MPCPLLLLGWKPAVVGLLLAYHVVLDDNVVAVAHSNRASVCIPDDGELHSLKVVSVLPDGLEIHGDTLIKTHAQFMALAKSISLGIADPEEKISIVRPSNAYCADLADPHNGKVGYTDFGAFALAFGDCSKPNGEVKECP